MKGEYSKPELIDLNDETGHGNPDCMNGSGNAAVCQIGTAAGSTCIGGSGILF